MNIIKNIKFIKYQSKKNIKLNLINIFKYKNELQIDSNNIIEKLLNLSKFEKKIINLNDESEKNNIVEKIKNYCQNNHLYNELQIYNNYQNFHFYQKYLIFIYILIIICLYYFIFNKSYSKFLLYLIDHYNYFIDKINSKFKINLEKYQYKKKSEFEYLDNIVTFKDVLVILSGNK